MNTGIFTIDFEVGMPIDGGVYGKGFDGTAEIDCDGKVVHISLETFATGPNGEFDVPRIFDESNPICWIADQIEGKYDDDIEDKLNEWSVSIAEKQFEAAE